MSDDKLITGTPAGANLSPSAGGQREFRANPEDFMNILARDKSFDINETKKYISGAAYNNNPVIDNTPNKDAMKEILMRLNETAEYAVEKTFREKDTQNEIKRAVLSEDYSDKEWAVLLNEKLTGKTIYDVVNKRAKKSFFNGLYLEEAAKKLCSFLEEGMPLNSPKISKVLYFDEMYKKHYDDAINFKRNYKTAIKRRDSNKASILESRFAMSKEKALDYKKQIKKI